MPHIVVEYTDNLDGQADMPGLLQMIAARCLDTGGVLPIAGVRVRAIRLTEYVIGDGRPEYAFVNVTVKLARGRDPEFKQTFFGAMFEAIKIHLRNVSEARPLALSMYLEEIDEAGAYRQNGVREALGLPQK
jgi:5-carboxymethyl-2-hydroxymuconate isomerase